MATAPGLPRPRFSYSFAAVQCMVGNVALSNFATDGGIEFDTEGQVFDSELSADGYRTYVAVSDEAVRVTVRLAETSGALALLRTILTTQVGAAFAGGPIPPCNFTLFCPSTGDRVFAPDLVFLKEGMPTKVKGLSMREFLFELPYARFTMLLGPENTPTP